MKKILLTMILVVLSANATTITELFDSLKKQPTTKLDNLNATFALKAQNKIDAKYYPTIELFGGYTHYNSQTALKPLDPITTGQLTKSNDPIPFSQTISNIGIKFSMPLFSKELGSLSNKAKYLVKSARLKKQINFYQNEATILASNSALEYLDNLLIALNGTKHSLLTTRKEIEISVKSGRMPGIALDKIDEKLNQMEIAINNTQIQQLNLISKIEAITGISLTQHISMEQIKDIDTSNMIVLKPLQNTIQANLSDLKASKEKRYYPKVALNVVYNKNYAQDNVQDDRNIQEGYGYYQLGVKLPLYDQSQSTDIELKKISLLKTKAKLEKTKLELISQTKSLQQELQLLYKSKKLNKRNIQREEDLLKYAKVAFKQGRITQENYLKYEDELLRAKSNYFKVQSKIWQVIAKLSVIYGNDLKGVVK